MKETHYYPPQIIFAQHSLKNIAKLDTLPFVDSAAVLVYYIHAMMLMISATSIICPNTQRP